MFRSIGLGHGHRSVCTIDACGMSGRETTKTRNARGKTEKAGSGKDMVHKIHAHCGAGLNRAPYFQEICVYEENLKIPAPKRV